MQRRMQITLWKNSTSLLKNSIFLKHGENGEFEFQSQHFLDIQSKIHWWKLNFLTKIGLLPQCVVGQTRKEKLKLLHKKVAQTAIFDIVSQLYSITCFEFPFSRILAMVLKDVEHQSWRWRRERISVIKYCKSCQQPLLWGGLKFPSRTPTNPKMKWWCCVNLGRRPRRRASHIFSHFYIYCV